MSSEFDRIQDSRAFLNFYVVIRIVELSKSVLYSQPINEIPSFKWPYWLKLNIRAGGITRL